MYNIHMIGSVPLGDAESVFRRLAEAFGAGAKRLPDGETGPRADWIGFVRRHLGKHPAFIKDEATPKFEFTQWDGKLIHAWHYLTYKPDVDPSAVTFDTGYADDAVRSFEIFQRLQAEGAIPSGTRYQACMATPLAIAYMYITPAVRKEFIRAYTDHLLGEINRMAAAIPHESLTVQFDVCQEVLMWEGYFDQPADYQEEILSILAELGNAVPAGVELGYHLCYGSPLDEHCVLPADMGVMVELANGLFPRLTRPLQFLHVPVPVDRRDDAFFSPLNALALPAGTELYLGCVHADDDDGNRARLDAAAAHTHVSGIATECGWGRGDPERLGAILDAHRALAGGNA